ncbi:hypothetical protein AOQ84DRAFT_354556 [Glonium stellatum]|uniref:Uncharacterized protein n=1 Tax=Glonium stellatum TaxID=574774 RepID=A0A8E2F0P2_9PEZI|nr:hypothetical protein AOQ84DRAFT_354556 [Glonium stellatum]
MFLVQATGFDILAGSGVARLRELAVLFLEYDLEGYMLGISPWLPHILGALCGDPE